MIKLTDNPTIEVSTKPHDFVHVVRDTIIYFTEPIKQFNPKLFILLCHKVYEFDCSLIYSFDHQKWSKEFPFTLDDELADALGEYLDRIVNGRDLNFFPHIYIGVSLKINEKLYSNGNVNFNENLPDTDRPHVDVVAVKYNGTNFTQDMLRFKTFDTYVNERYPKWNMYDNMSVVINQWLNRVDAITQMYGHTCVYFKTVPKTVNNTLQVTDEKEIVSIKRFLVTFPGNQLPKDTMTYTEWDYAMAEESFVEVNWRYFKTIFGETIPEDGDLIFIPIVSKLFKVVHVEPDEDKKFMGKIGWFNAYIQKYTDNDTTTLHQDMNDVVNGFGFLEQEDQFMHDAIESVKEHIDPVLIDKDEIRANTNEEKKAATENYTNKFKDTSYLAEVKETDAIRKEINKRLKIVSINPDQNSFPVNMYDLSDVTRKILAMNLSIVNVCRISRLPQSADSEISISFNYAQLSRHNGPFLDIQGENGLVGSIFLKNDQFGFVSNNSEKEENIFAHTIKYNEYYQITFVITQKSVHCSISLLRDKQKKLLYSDLYISSEKLFLSTKDPNTDIFTGIDVFGGKILIGEPTFKIDDTLIFTDYVNPVLNFNGGGSTI